MPGQDFRVQATRGFVWNYLYKISEFGLINLYTILVVRQLGPDVSAPYAIFLAVGSLLAMVGAFGVDGVLLRFIQRVVGNTGGSEERFDRIETLTLPHFLTTLLGFRLMTVSVVSVLIVVSLSVLPALVPSFAGVFGSLTSEVPYLIAFLFTQSLVAFSTLALTGLLETRRVFIASVVSRFLLLCGGLVVLQSTRFTTDLAIGIFVGSYVLSALMLVMALRAVVRSRSAHLGERKHLSAARVLRSMGALIRVPRRIGAFLATPIMLYGITTWGNDLLSSILGKQSDVLVMGVMLGERAAEIGYYQAASLVLLVTEYVFLFGLGGAIVSVFSKLVHDDEQAHGGTHYPLLLRARREIAGSQNVLLIPLCLYVLFFTEPIVLTLFGGKFAASIPMIRVGLAALLTSVGAFGGGVQVTTLVAVGKERLVFRNRLFWGIANMVVNIPLIHFFGGMGALIGTQYANLSAVIAEWFFSRKWVGNSTDVSGTVRILFASVVAAFISYLLLNSQLIDAGPWSAMIGGAVIDGLLVLTLYKVLRVPEVSVLLHRLRGAS